MVFQSQRLKGGPTIFGSQTFCLNQTHSAWESKSKRIPFTTPWGLHSWRCQTPRAFLMTPSHPKDPKSSAQPHWQHRGWRFLDPVSQKNTSYRMDCQICQLSTGEIWWNYVLDLWTSHTKFTKSYQIITFWAGHGGSMVCLTQISLASHCRWRATLHLAA